MQKESSDAHSYTDQLPDIAKCGTLVLPASLENFSHTMMCYTDHRLSIWGVKIVISKAKTGVTASR
jgi:hypothetical protein